jgi:hypothetical protein
VQKGLQVCIGKWKGLLSKLHGVRQIRDLYPPFDLDILPENFPLYFSIDQPITTNAYLVDPSMLFLLIYSDIRDATTYSSANVVELLSIAMTNLSQESRKEHNRITHFSS